MKKNAWFLLDNRMGSVGQAKGVMQSLDESKFDIIEKKIEYTRLAALPNCLPGSNASRADKRQQSFSLWRFSRSGCFVQPADGADSALAEEKIRRKNKNRSAYASRQQRLERF